MRRPSAQEGPTLRHVVPVISTRWVLVAIAGAAVIGTSAVLMALARVEPATASLFRCAYAVPPLAALAFLERRRLGSRSRHSHRFAATSGVFLGVNFILLNTAIPMIGAGLATVLGNLQVLIVSVLGWVFFSERPTPRLALALPFCLVGVAMISGAFSAHAYGPRPVLGGLVSVGTSVAYAAYMLLMRQSQRRSDPHICGPLLEATAVSAITCLVLGPFAGGIDLGFHWPAHGWLLLSAIGPQVIGWLLITAALAQLPVALTSTLLLLQPLVAVLFAGAVLGEDPATSQLLGCAVLLTAATYAVRGGRSRRRNGSAGPVQPRA